MNIEKNSFKEIILKRFEDGTHNVLPVVIKNNELFLEYVLNETVFLNDNLQYEPTISQRLWHIIHNENEIPKCQECGTEVLFEKIGKGYYKTCSEKCRCGQTAIKVRERTNMNKFGVPNVMCDDKFINKIKQTKKERYGDENYCNVEKIKKTNYEIYGNEYPIRLKKIQKKIKKTNLEKYGDENYVNVEKAKETKLRRYGNANYVNTEKIKETKLERYGDENYNNRNKAKKTSEERYGESGYNNREKCAETKLLNHNDSNYNNRVKATQTNLEIYGVDVASKLETTKQKVINTNMEKYGVPHTMQNEQVKQKSIETKIIKYGSTSFVNIKKTKETKLAKYGDENYVNIEKHKSTIKEKYGVDNVSQIDSVKKKKIQTSIKNYGTEYPMQNLELASSTKKKALTKRTYIFPSGRTVLIQGFENRSIDILLMTNSEYDIIVEDSEIANLIGEIWYMKNGSMHRYFPDLYLTNTNKIIETKSTWTYSVDKNDNLLKKEACINSGINFEFFIFDEKYNLIPEDGVEKLFNFSLKESTV